jgi:hypothetical protein
MLGRSVGDQLVRGQLRQRHRLVEPLGGGLGRQRAGPSGVRGDQDQAAERGRVPPAVLDGERAAERQPGHMRPVDADPLDEPPQAVGVARHAEPLRGSDDSPTPGASQAITVNSSDKPSSWRRQVTAPSPT